MDDVRLSASRLSNLRGSIPVLFKEVFRSGYRELLGE